ncbi:MAG: DoxX family membrane protein [Flavobacteriales bacterium]|nr:DoxX family membrane protein [Flavobacteriales bacterium]
MVGPSSWASRASWTLCRSIGLGPTFSLILIVFAEVLCSLLVVLGLWTRVAPNCH